VLIERTDYITSCMGLSTIELSELIDVPVKTKETLSEKYNKKKRLMSGWV